MLETCDALHRLRPLHLRANLLARCNLKGTRRLTLCMGWDSGSGSSSSVTIIFRRRRRCRHLSCCHRCRCRIWRHRGIISLRFAGRHTWCLHGISVRRRCSRRLRSSHPIGESRRSHWAVRRRCCRHGSRSGPRIFRWFSACSQRGILRECVVQLGFRSRQTRLERALLVLQHRNLPLQCREMLLLPTSASACRLAVAEHASLPSHVDIAVGIQLVFRVPRRVVAIAHCLPWRWWRRRPSSHSVRGCHAVRGWWGRWRRRRRSCHRGGSVNRLGGICSAHGELRHGSRGSRGVLLKHLRWHTTWCPAREACKLSRVHAWRSVVRGVRRCRPWVQTSSCSGVGERGVCCRGGVTRRSRRSWRGCRRLLLRWWRRHCALRVWCCHSLVGRCVSRHGCEAWGHLSRPRERS
mmetsp:Transcript_2899/g.7454  ORF Transcript_2899/g.7454 Transcript_2899/m.7454 type:complete len:408 (+) Transcript_2899:190-1413(+)